MRNAFRTPRECLTSKTAEAILYTFLNTLTPPPSQLSIESLMRFTIAYFKSYQVDFVGLLQEHALKFGEESAEDVWAKVVPKAFLMIQPIPNDPNKEINYTDTAHTLG